MRTSIDFYHMFVTSFFPTKSNTKTTYFEKQNPTKLPLHNPTISMIPVTIPICLIPVPTPNYMTAIPLNRTLRIADTSIPTTRSGTILAMHTLVWIIDNGIFQQIGFACAMRMWWRTESWRVARREGGRVRKSWRSFAR